MTDLRGLNWRRLQLPTRNRHSLDQPPNAIHGVGSWAQASDGWESRAYFSTVTVAGSCSRTVTGEPDDSVAALRPPAMTAAVPAPAPTDPPIAAPFAPPRMPPRIAPPIAPPPIFAALCVA